MRIFIYSGRGGYREELDGAEAQNTDTALGWGLWEPQGTDERGQHVAGSRGAVSMRDAGVGGVGSQQTVPGGGNLVDSDVVSSQSHQEAGLAWRGGAARVVLGAGSDSV